MKENYKTEQRELINEFLISNKDKFISAGELLEYMKEKKESVGETTIYRFLKLLEEKNCVRTEIKNHTKYYQYISNDCMTHFHLKCKKCGKTIHLECNSFDNVNKHINEKHGFILDHNTIIYGTCEKCKI